MNTQLDRDIEKLESMAELMDSRFKIPGTSISFGLDSLLGLIPGIGDTVTLISTAYLMGKARAYKLPWQVTLRMLCNALLDWLIGLIPIIGDIFDIAWKANKKNVALIKKHLKSRTQ
jgi:hypothetical protein|tara:strand:+ start:79134 stop:79484 length:351 start_codon:yes stop_codon:yes gene_type:complete